MDHSDKKAKLLLSGEKFIDADNLIMSRISSATYQVNHNPRLDVSNYIFDPDDSFREFEDVNIFASINLKAKLTKDQEYNLNRAKSVKLVLLDEFGRVIT